MRTIYIYGGWSNSYKGDLWSWKVPYRNVTLLNATFDNGDGEDDKTCYSKFRYYEFEVSVKDAVSYKYLDKVSIQLGSGIEIFWNEAIDEFIVIDPNNYIELSSNSYAEHDESQTWLIHYLVKFNWTYPTESYQNVQASAWNKNGFTDFQ